MGNEEAPEVKRLFAQEQGWVTAADLDILVWGRPLSDRDWVYSWHDQQMLIQFMQECGTLARVRYGWETVDGHDVLLLPHYLPEDIEKAQWSSAQHDLRSAYQVRKEAGSQCCHLEGPALDRSLFQQLMVLVLRNYTDDVLAWRDGFIIGADDNSVLAAAELHPLPAATYGHRLEIRAGSDDPAALFTAQALLSALDKYSSVQDGKKRKTLTTPAGWEFSPADATQAARAEYVGSSLEDTNERTAAVNSPSEVERSEILSKEPPSIGISYAGGREAKNIEPELDDVYPDGVPIATPDGWRCTGDDELPARLSRILDDQAKARGALFKIRDYQQDSNESCSKMGSKRAIGQSDFFVLLLSRKYWFSDECMYEMMLHYRMLPEKEFSPDYCDIYVPTDANLDKKTSEESSARMLEVCQNFWKGEWKRCLGNDKRVEEREINQQAFETWKIENPRNGLLAFLEEDHFNFPFWTAISELAVERIFYDSEISDAVLEERAQKILDRLFDPVIWLQRATRSWLRLRELEQQNAGATDFEVNDLEKRMFSWLLRFKEATVGNSDISIDDAVTWEAVTAAGIESVSEFNAMKEEFIKCYEKR